LLHFARSATGTKLAMKLALKIDVRTWRGTREGVPWLMDVLAASKAGATFLFNLGPDHSGRAAGALFRRGMPSHLGRQPLVSQYGIKTLFYGTLLPAPDIGAECADVMRSARDAGFEVGMHAWDRVAWQRGAAGAGAEWTHRQMQLACARFGEIFGEPPRVHGAAGWQMNRHAYRLTQRLGFSYSSDTRGRGPFIPVCKAEIVACPQLPTTLPTFDELIGTQGTRVDGLAERLLALSREPSPAGHVFTLRAELGKRLAPAFEALLRGWQAEGFEVVSLGQYMEALVFSDLPRHEIADGEVAGRPGSLALQGREFLAGA
jgi:undecaprenyl phosphate-alpha-L-ara4FN deformylase